MIKVVCAIIEKEGLILACRRKAGKARGGKWEFPGGKIKTGESPEEAIERELLEELSVYVAVDGVLGAVVHHYPDVSIELIAMKCKIEEGVIRLTDHNEFRWISLRELKSVDFSEADCGIVDKMLLRK